MKPKAPRSNDELEVEFAWCLKFISNVRKDGVCSQVSLFVSKSRGDPDVQVSSVGALMCIRILRFPILLCCVCIESYIFENRNWIELGRGSLMIVR